jgi:peptide/nickel transport system substrate-binding protein
LTRARRLVPTLAAVIVASAPVATGAADFIETPSLKKAVERGMLPPVGDRLPARSLVIDLPAHGKEIGRHGGTLRMLAGRAQDTRMMVVYGYARLVGFTTDWKLDPDILERVEVDGNRVFTFHLRKGHKWSDGEPFTSEDFRYTWEDILTDEDISPTGLPSFLLADGRRPRFEVLDETTVRYTWDAPNPHFLATIAGARPEYLYAPAHYLRQFHAKYVDADTLGQRAKEAGQRNWVSLHFLKSHQYKNDNPDLPTLQPWQLVTPPPSNRFVFRRNYYFHHVDTEGRQLPYIDEVVMTVVNASLIPAKTAAGDTDLQARGLGFENYAILKQGEKRHDYTVHLWRTAVGAEMALYPNLTVDDPTWRATMRHADVRRALSLAIDREEINQTIFFGLADPHGNTVIDSGPLYRAAYAEAWNAFDVDAANRLLDGAGLNKRDRRGVRLMSDGRPLEILVETAGENPTETDVLQLIRDTWVQTGVKLHIKPLQRDVLRNRVFAGTTVMSVWKGFENAVPTPDTAPLELAPTNQQQLEWAKWGLNYETRGQAGEAVDMPEAAELLTLFRRWEITTEEAERTAIWHRMLEIHADQVFIIGIVRGIPQPVVVGNRLRNVPREGIYNWEPGAHFGVHRLDAAWFDDER